MPGNPSPEYLAFKDQLRRARALAEVELEEEEEDLDYDPHERISERDHERVYAEACKFLNDPRNIDPRGYREKLFCRGDHYADVPQDEVSSFLVDGFLPRGYLAILGGTSKAGKSCFATALAVAVAKGEPFLGMATEQAPVLWCANEESQRERLTSLLEFGSVPPWLFVTHERPFIDQPEDLINLEWWIQKTGAGLLVVDPLFGATKGSLSDGRTARQAMMNLKTLSTQGNIAVLVLHHINKDSSSGLNRDRFAESNQILATASMDLLMDVDELPDGARQIRLQGKGRGQFANRTWLIRSEGPAHFELIGDGTAGTSGLKMEAIVHALSAESLPLSSEQIAERTGQPLQQTRNLITYLVKQGRLVVAEKQGRTRLYSVAPE